jgi:hypothetical protein
MLQKGCYYTVFGGNKVIRENLQYTGCETEHTIIFNALMLSEGGDKFLSVEIQVSKHFNYSFEMVK